MTPLRRSSSDLITLPLLAVGPAGFINSRGAPGLLPERRAGTDRARWRPAVVEAPADAGAFDEGTERVAGADLASDVRSLCLASRTFWNPPRYRPARSLDAWLRRQPGPSRPAR